LASTMASVEELKTAGNASFKEGKYQDAVHHFSGAIAKDGTNAVLFSNRSGALASMGKYDEALLDADKATSLRPEWGKVYSRRAAALYGLGRYAESIETYKRGLEVEPGNPQMTQAAADVSAKLADCRALFDAASTANLTKMQSILHTGVHADGYLAEEGSSALMAAAKTGSAEAVSLLLRSGALASRKNRGGESAHALARKGGHESVLKVLPPEEKAPFGGFFAAAKEFASSAARDLAEKAKVKSASAGEAVGEEYEALLRKREERRKREEELKAAEAFAAKRKSIEAALLRSAEEEDLKLVRALSEQRLREEREAAAEQVRREEEQRAAAAALAEAEAAAAEATRAEAEAKAREKQAEDLKHAGNEAFKASQYAEAVRLYTQALELDADNAVLFSNRSGALAAIGNYPQALVDADRAVAIRPDWAKGYTRKASSLHGLKRFLAAVEAYEEALELEPTNETLIKGRRQSSFALAIEA